MNQENDNSKFSVKIGNTTYIICAKQSENATKPLESIFRDFCRQEVLNNGESCTDSSLVDLENVGDALSPACDG